MTTDEIHTSVHMNDTDSVFSQICSQQYQDISSSACKARWSGNWQKVKSHADMCPVFTAAHDQTDMKWTRRCGYDGLPRPRSLRHQYAENDRTNTTSCQRLPAATNQYTLNFTGTDLQHIGRSVISFCLQDVI